MLFLNRSAHILHDDNARVFDTVGRVWRRVPESAEGGSEIELFDAVRWLQRESGKPARAPVSIAGPRTHLLPNLPMLKRLAMALLNSAYLFCAEDWKA